MDDQLRGVRVHPRRGVEERHIGSGSEERRARAGEAGSGSIVTPSGYLAFVFIFFVLAVSLFACAQIGAARHEEADQRLETLLSLPVGRVQWFGGRLVLAVAGVVVLGLVSGLGTWAGAEAAGVAISLPQMLEAGANAVPVAVLFLGLAALAYAIVPRASAGIAYGLVTVAFLWQLVGSLVGVPKWLVDLTPFGHIGFVPTQSFKVTAAIVMAAIGAAGGGCRDRRVPPAGPGRSVTGAAPARSRLASGGCGHCPDNRSAPPIWSRGHGNQCHSVRRLVTYWDDPPLLPPAGRGPRRLRDQRKAALLGRRSRTTQRGTPRHAPSCRRSRTAPRATRPSTVSGRSARASARCRG